MDRSHEYARLAGELRRVWPRLARVCDSLIELRQGDLAAQVTDLELQCAKLAEQLVHLAAQPYRLPRREESPNPLSQEELPF